MIQLIYVSTATSRISADDLQSLMFISQANNLRFNITGLLIYDQGTFCQVLEGERDAVHDLYEKIKLDNMHNNLIKFYDDLIERREFSSWSMKCINLDQYNKYEIRGYREFNDLVHNWNFINPLAAKNLLLYFNKN